MAERYTCPECRKETVNEDLRARHFLCYNAKCGFSMPFETYLEIAAALRDEPLRDGKGSAVDQYRLPANVIVAILNVGCEVQKSKADTTARLKAGGTEVEKLRAQDADGGLRLLLRK